MLQNRTQLLYQMQWILATQYKIYWYIIIRISTHTQAIIISLSQTLYSYSSPTYFLKPYIIVITYNKKKESDWSSPSTLVTAIGDTDDDDDDDVADDSGTMNWL